MGEPGVQLGLLDPRDLPNAEKMPPLLLGPPVNPAALAADNDSGLLAADSEPDAAAAGARADGLPGAAIAVDAGLTGTSTVRPSFKLPFLLALRVFLPVGLAGDAGADPVV